MEDLLDSNHLTNAVFTSVLCATYFSLVQEKFLLMWDLREISVHSDDYFKDLIGQGWPLSVIVIVV